MSDENKPQQPDPALPPEYHQPTAEQPATPSPGAGAPTCQVFTGRSQERDRLEESTHETVDPWTH